MEWTDEAIVLATRPHGESSLLVQLLTRERGRHAGLAKGGQGRKVRAIYQPGNRVTATWKARLEEQLGQLTCELVRSDLALFIEDGDRLACFGAAAAVAEGALPEREAMPRVYEKFGALLTALADDGAWLAHYVGWELDLLAEIGFGLDLARCAVTGSTEHLAFVSPKSGRAVSFAAGQPYQDKLFRLPAFLLEPEIPETTPARHDALPALDLTGFFLARHVFQPHGNDLPAARSRFVDRLRASPQTQ